MFLQRQEVERISSLNHNTESICFFLPLCTVGSVPAGFSATITKVHVQTTMEKDAYYIETMSLGNEKLPWE